MEYDQGEFSHVEILFWDKNEWYVVHRAPAEISGRINGVVIDPLSFYIDQNDLNDLPFMIPNDD